MVYPFSYIIWVVLPLDISENPLSFLYRSIKIESVLNQYRISGTCTLRKLSAQGLLVTNVAGAQYLEMKPTAQM